MLRSRLDGLAEEIRNLIAAADQVKDLETAIDLINARGHVDAALARLARLDDIRTRTAHYRSSAHMPLGTPVAAPVAAPVARAASRAASRTASRTAAQASAEVAEEQTEEQEEEEEEAEEEAEEAEEQEAQAEEQEAQAEEEAPLLNRILVWMRHPSRAAVSHAPGVVRKSIGNPTPSSGEFTAACKVLQARSVIEAGGQGAGRRIWLI